MENIDFMKKQLEIAFKNKDEFSILIITKRLEMLGYSFEPIYSN